MRPEMLALIDALLAEEPFPQRCGTSGQAKRKKAGEKITLVGLHQQREQHVWKWKLEGV